jgi:hypothetical protein
MSNARTVLGGLILAAALAAFSAPALAQSDAPPAASSAGPPKTVETPPRPGTSEDVVIAPEQKRATSPDGDPRSSGEKHDDQMAYDQCLMRAPQSDMAHPVDSTPEEYCSHRLGMEDRNAVPNSVRNPKRSH